MDVGEYSYRAGGRKGRLKRSKDKTIIKWISEDSVFKRYNELIWENNISSGRKLYGKLF